MKVIIAGSRNYKDKENLFNVCDYMLSESKGVEIVSGGANGADTLGEIYAKDRNLPVKQFVPDWNTFGKSAGVLRNIAMAEYADSLIAFWDKKSKGTAHMIRAARSKGLLVKVVEEKLSKEDKEWLDAQLTKDYDE